MELVDFFTGKWLNSVDAKGRVSVPSSLRKIVTARMADSKSVMLGKAPEEPCIRGFERVSLAMAYKDLRSQQEADISNGRATGNRFAASGSLFGAIEDVAIDGSGRIILPPNLRRRAGITDSAMFVGVGETFEIWSLEVALATTERPDVREFAEDLIAERDGKS